MGGENERYYYGTYGLFDLQLALSVFVCFCSVGSRAEPTVAKCGTVLAALHCTVLLKCCAMICFIFILHMYIGCRVKSNWRSCMRHGCYLVFLFRCRCRGRGSNAPLCISFWRSACSVGLSWCWWCFRRRGRAQRTQQPNEAPGGLFLLGHFSLVPPLRSEVVDNNGNVWLEGWVGVE